MLFDYFYGSETEQFSFYRIPKLLVTSKKFKKLSDSAKILYGLMLDRMSLSLKNNWVDEDNKAYIYFTTDDVMELMCCGTQKATKLIAELDTDKGIGLIERKKQGQGKPAKIYVKKFFAEDMPEDNSKSEETPAVEEYDCELNKAAGFAKGEVCSNSASNINSRSYKVTEAIDDIDVKFEKQCMEYNSETQKMNAYIQENSDNKHYTSKEKSYRNSDYLPNTKAFDKEYKQNIELVKARIDYDLMIIENGRELVDEAVEIMAEVLTVPRDYCIEGINYPYSIVRNRFEKIGYEKLSAFFIRFSKYANEIRNMKSYMITSLFNASSTAATSMMNSINSGRKDMRSRL